MKVSLKLNGIWLDILHTQGTTSNSWGSFFFFVKHVSGVSDKNNLISNGHFVAFSGAFSCVSWFSSVNGTGFEVIISKWGRPEQNRLSCNSVPQFPQMATHSVTCTVPTGTTEPPWSKLYFHPVWVQVHHSVTRYCWLRSEDTNIKTVNCKRKNCGAHFHQCDENKDPLSHYTEKLSK